jgi:hypothetical protein
LWLLRPGGQRDVWITAAACLLLAASVPVYRSSRALFVVPAAPVTHFALPHVPSEAFAHTLQTVVESPQEDAEGNLHPKVGQERSSLKASRSVKLAAARRKEPAVSSKQISPPNPVASPAPASESVAKAAPAPMLHIEITSNVNEGTLAIFAERELLFTTNLAAMAAGEAVRFEHPLPAGAHQLRVALYKPDKSLRLEKEGLAEIRSGLANTLAVHVNRHSKLLVRREVALDVIWPAAPVPGSERAAATAKASALMQ